MGGRTCFEGISRFVVKTLRDLYIKLITFYLSASYTLYTLKNVSLTYNVSQ